MFADGSPAGGAGTEDDLLKVQCSRDSLCVATLPCERTVGFPSPPHWLLHPDVETLGQPPFLAVRDLYLLLSLPASRSE